MKTNRKKEFIVFLAMIFVGILFFGIPYFIVRAYDFGWEPIYLKAAAFCLLTLVGLVVFAVRKHNKAVERMVTKEVEKIKKLEKEALISQTLYYRFASRIEYWNVWVENRNEKETVIIFQGIVGQLGEETIVATAPNSTAWETARVESGKKRRQGYAPLDEEAEVWFDVICRIDDLKTFSEYSKDICYHQKLVSLLIDILVPTFAGDVDIPLPRPGDIEIPCSVIDFKIAKELIEKELAGTEFQNFEIRMVDKNDKENRLRRNRI